jgi:hypothetical protein
MRRRCRRCTREGHLQAYRCINSDLLVAMDGTRYFASQKIHCPHCRVTKHANGTLTYPCAMLKMRCT